MGKQFTFNDILQRVWDTVPVQPLSSEWGSPTYQERLDKYYAWRDRQAGYIRENGSKVGFPCSDHRNPHGERAARRPSSGRHIRTVPRHDKSAVWAGIARHHHRINPRLFNQPAFTPAFMYYAPPAPKPVIERPVVVVAPPKPAMPILALSVAQPAVQHYTTRHLIPVAPKPAGLWRPTPVRPPLKRMEVKYA